MSSRPGCMTDFRCRQTDSRCAGFVARARQKLLIRATFLVALMSSKTARTRGLVVFSSTSFTVAMVHLRLRRRRENERPGPSRRGEVLGQRALQCLGVVNGGLPEVMDFPAVVGLDEVHRRPFADNDLLVGRLQRRFLAGLGCYHDIVSNRRPAAAQRQ